MSEYCKKKMRRVIVSSVSRFANPFCDESDPTFQSEEIEIVLKLLDGIELSQSRHYFDDLGTYVVSWVWTKYPEYPRQWDGPVEKLISRGVLRSIRCAGGYTKMIFTELAQTILGDRAKQQANWRLMGSKVDFDLPEVSHA